MNKRGWRASQALRRLVPGLLVLAVALLPACAHRATLPDTAAAAASSGLPYGGFALGTDADGGALVADVIAGPAALAGLSPGDRIDTVAGEKVGAARLLQILQASSPGTRLPLRVIRNGRVLAIEFVVGDRAQWASPSASAARVAFVAPPPRTSPVWLDGVMAKVAAATPELSAERERIQRMFDDLVRKEGGFNNLLLNRQALADPGTLIEWERRLVADMQPGAEARNRLVLLLCEILSHDCAGMRSVTPVAGAPPSLAQFAQSIAAANRRVRAAFAAAGPRDRLFRHLRYLLEETATKRTLIDQPDALTGIRAMQASLRVDFVALLDAFDRLIAAASQPPAASPGVRRKIPAELAAMVDGEILDYEQLDGGYVVIGGPGAGWLGAAVLIDLAGNDTYVSALGGCGAGAFGFGLLFDAAGTDVYRCDAWSAGAGIYGAGLLHDAAGNDFYYGGRYTQGFAAHQASGLFSDLAGDDVYWGMRAAAQGAAWDQSVAILYDGGGNDFYRAESLAQGAAAQQSRAWLVDAGGDDRYSSELANGQLRVRHEPGTPPNGRGNSGVALDEGP